MRRRVVAIRGRGGGDGGQDRQRGRATCVLAQEAVWVGAAEVSLLVLVVVRSLRNAREQDGDGHRQGDAPADPELREGPWKRAHTPRAGVLRCDPIEERRSRFCHFTFMSSKALRLYYNIARLGSL